MPRISDSELAANVRQRNRQASERRRQRLAIAGKVQLLTWLPDTLRRELDSVAAARREPVSETAAAAILAGLKQIPTNPVSAYHCYQCDARMTVEREKEPLCEKCESASQLATTPASNNTQPMYTGCGDRDALMVETGKLLADGLSGADIARRLTAAGYRSPTGAALTGANLLRDYRAWLKRQTTA